MRRSKVNVFACKPPMLDPAGSRKRRLSWAPAVGLIS